MSTFEKQGSFLTIKAFSSPHLSTCDVATPLCFSLFCYLRTPSSHAYTVRSSSTMSRHPSVKWAQRSDKVYITIELPDAKDVKLKLEPEGKFFFSATKDGMPYEVDLELLDKINVEESKYNIGVRHIVYVIQKAEKKWWSRLIKQEGKPPAFLKVDWDRWVDEDEENEKQFDFDDMDFSKLDMGGDDDFDMDDTNDEEEETKEGEAAGKEESMAPIDEEVKAKEEPVQPVAEETKA